MKKLITALVFITLTQYVNSQCLTDYYHKKAKETFKGIEAEEQRFNASVVQLGNAKRATKYIIPVVFHVIHTNGPENISKAQIEDQIRILNQDFSFNNPNKAAIRSAFTGVAADCEIEFRLAQVDPSGKCTDGINRVFSPLHVEAKDQVKSISGARWDNRKYLNVWTVSSIDNSGGTGITLGYAYLPSTVSQFGMGNVDGIVVRADYVGTIGTGSVDAAGRTLTHEVGHYLGLLHTFEDGCPAAGANLSTTGDFCGDTPPVSGTFTNQNCPANGNSCNESPNLIDQWENYMDYSRGSCQSMFTLNQKSRMHAAITGYTFRTSLVSANNLIATGVVKGNTAPVAFFSSSVRIACTGDPVYYYDNSCKAQVTSKQWTFTGANVSSTNKDTPVVIYSTPGRYKVTLMVSNANGSNTLAVDNYIEVRPRVAIDKPALIQNFDKASWNIGTGWTVLDPGTPKFTRDSTTGYRGFTSLVAPISGSVPNGQRFQLVTPPVDMRKLAGKSPKISMMIGYLRQNTASNEELRLYVSRGCDYKWSQILYRNASFLSYNGSQFANGFKPSDASHWKLLSFGLSAFENDSNVSFMIEISSGSGNPVYIDEINISDYTTGLGNIENIRSLQVYPNPAENSISIRFESESSDNEIWLEDMQGKRVAEIMKDNTLSGEINIQYSKSPLLSSGMYILKLRSGEHITNKKVIFAN